MSQDKFVLHWLNESRATRITWLLEELNLNYEVKVYKRDKKVRAPADLKKVHPLGKAPVVEVFKAGSETPVVLAETGHIILYIIRHYDTEKKLTPSSPEDQELVDYYLHFAEGSLQNYLVGVLVNHLALQQAPYFARFLVNTITGKINSLYYGAETIKSLTFLEDQLAKKQNKKFFVGDKLTGADIMLSFPVHENIFGQKERARMLGLSLLDKFPHLQQWSLGISNEPNYLKVKTNEAKL